MLFIAMTAKCGVHATVHDGTIGRYNLAQLHMLQQACNVALPVHVWLGDLQSALSSCQTLSTSICSVLFVKKKLLVLHSFYPASI